MTPDSKGSSAVALGSAKIPRRPTEIETQAVPIFNDNAGRIGFTSNPGKQQNLKCKQINTSQVPKWDTKHCHQNHSLTISPICLFVCPALPRTLHARIEFRFSSPVAKPCKQTAHPRFLGNCPPPSPDSAQGCRQLYTNRVPLEPCVLLGFGGAQFPGTQGPSCSLGVYLG